MADKRMCMQVQCMCLCRPMGYHRLNWSWLYLIWLDKTRRGVPSAFCTNLSHSGSRHRAPRRRTTNLGREPAAALHLTLYRLRLDSRDRRTSATTAALFIDELFRADDDLDGRKYTRLLSLSLSPSSASSLHQMPRSSGRCIAEARNTDKR